MPKLSHLGTGTLLVVSLVRSGPRRAVDRMPIDEHLELRFFSGAEARLDPAYAALVAQITHEMAGALTA